MLVQSDRIHGATTSSDGGNERGQLNEQFTCSRAERSQDELPPHEATWYKELIMLTSSVMGPALVSCDLIQLFQICLAAPVQ